MIRSGLILMIRSKAQEGQSPYSIGKELGISKNTAKKYLHGEIREHELKGRKKPSKLDPYKADIDEMMRNGIFNCMVINERLKEYGYSGSITIIKDYVHPGRPPRNSPAVMRFETPPGRQVQMDWGITRYIDETGDIRKAAFFAMIMCSSRAKYAEFTKRCDLYSLMRCMVNAFEYFGGIPETVLTDRMKTVVSGSEAGSPVWNSRFEDFAADMGFIPKVCRPYRAQTKGKVERLVRYIKDSFLPGRQFCDINDLNLQAMEWCRKADGRIHASTGRVPLEALKEENLLKLPEKHVLDRYRWETRRVSRDGFVSYDGARYGVPWEYSGKEVRVRICEGEFEAYDGEVRITHSKVEHVSGRVVWLKGQYTGLSERNGVALAFPFARKDSVPSVEVRPLSVYDRIAGVVSDG